MPDFAIDVIKIIVLTGVALWIASRIEFGEPLGGLYRKPKNKGEVFMTAEERKIARGKEAIALAIRGYIAMTCRHRAGEAYSGFAERKALEFVEEIDAAIEDHVGLMRASGVSRD